MYNFNKGITYIDIYLGILNHFLLSLLKAILLATIIAVLAIMLVNGMVNIYESDLYILGKIGMFLILSGFSGTLLYQLFKYYIKIPFAFKEIYKKEIEALNKELKEIENKK